MNYEVRPFQNYGSITIDELKDQATKQREAFYQSAKEVYREINYTGT